MDNQWLDGFTDEEIAAAVRELPEEVVAALLAEQSIRGGVPAEASPLEEALVLNPNYRRVDHLTYLSDCIAQAVRKVEAGESQFLMVSMPPRSGKSDLSSIYTPAWILHKHPDWKIGLFAHSPSLATNWGRQVRRLVETRGERLGVQIAPDAGAVSEWQTTEGGSVVSRSAPGQAATGLGFKVLCIDDATKDAATAHSKNARDTLWSWYQSVALTRLEPPSLTIVIGTRWHEDDLLGRLRNPTYNPDRDEWTHVVFPAIATRDDVLGRAEGDPLYSPLLVETREEALARWAKTRRSVGSYTWSALYQQNPLPAEGTIFDVSQIRYWTRNPSYADGERVIVWDPSRAQAGTWVDSWDLTFTDGETSDYVVGQRWCRVGGDRFLVAQQRGRWAFTEQVARFRAWGKPGSDSLDSSSPYGRLVGRRLVEKAANGAALIDTLKREVAGISPVKPLGSKEQRARAVTPEIESGNVFLPFPGESGNEWVNELVNEIREFPNGVHDDQVDAMDQALFALRASRSGSGSLTVPGVTRSPARRVRQPGLAVVTQRIR